MENIIFIFVLLSIVISLYLTTRSVTTSKELNQAIRDRLDQMIREVKVEKHNDTMYWFDKENDKFLAQGQTLDEIREVLKQRFPKNVFVLEHKLYPGPDFNPITLEDWAESLKSALK